MEEIYPPDKFPCSDHIPLKDYFSELSSLPLNQADLQIGRNTAEVNEAILDSMKIFDKNKRNELTKACSLDLLTPPDGESTAEETPSTSQAGVRTQTNTRSGAWKDLEIVKLRKKLDKICSRQKAHVRGKRTLQGIKKHRSANIEPKEFAIAIRVYHPYTIPSKIHKNSYRNLKFSHEIVVLGSNTLADLRDKILCIADAGISAETKDLTATPTAGNAKEKYPSGFIFIDDVFYNDTRHEKHIDYSEVIIKWAQQKGIGPFKTETLQTTKMVELSPRFGYPYVYQHQGMCEHILVFSDAWLLSTKDPLNTKDYPYYREIDPQRQKTCDLCYSSQAKWICAESDRLPHTIFACKGCLMQYHYKDGKRMGNFRIFPYFDHMSNSSH